MVAFGGGSLFCFVFQSGRGVELENVRGYNLYFFMSKCREEKQIVDC